MLVVHKNNDGLAFFFLNRVHSGTVVIIVLFILHPTHSGTSVYSIYPTHIRRHCSTAESS